MTFGYRRYENTAGMAGRPVLRATRAEKRERTRAELIEVAYRRFRAQGFRRTSLEEIADLAGYTKGAVYSNFPGGKDELFLALIEEHITARMHEYVAAALAEPTFEGAIGAVARRLSDYGAREPGWGPVLVEFWSHASRREGLREAASAAHERQVDIVAGGLDALAARHAVAFRIPARELARACAALARGLGAERFLNPSAAPPEQFEAMVVALVLGLTEEVT